MNNTKVVVTGVTEVIDGIDIDRHSGPTCVTLPDGVVIMLYGSTDAHVGTVGGHHIRFSGNYGETWTDADKTLAGESIIGTSENGDLYLLEAPNGNLLIMFARVWGESASGTWQSVSTDGGATWSASAPVAITGIVGDTDFLALPDDHFIYDGDIYLSGRISEDGDQTGVKSVLVKSEDNGANWVFVSDITSANTNEVGIEYLGDNRIIAMIRHNSMQYSPIRKFSNDMGATWSSMDSLTTWMTRTSNKNRIYTLAHLKGEANWWEDDHLLMCGFEYISGTGRRNALWFSNNGGITWTEPQVMDDWYEDAGYGDIFWNPVTDEVVFMCYRGHSYGASDVVQYNVTVDWNEA